MQRRPQIIAGLAAVGSYAYENEQHRVGQPTKAAAADLSPPRMNPAQQHMILGGSGKEAGPAYLWRHSGQGRWVRVGEMRV